MTLKKYLDRKLFVLQQGTRAKTFVFILSCMRSGSTLLKSLLAMGPDVSHLPEIDFQRYTGVTASWKLKALSDRRIMILKKPAPLRFEQYPQLSQFRSSKQVILIRDAYETVASLQQMIKRVYPELRTHWTPQQLLEHYWVPVNQALLERHQSSSDTILVRYEDLTTDAITATEKLFRFIGSDQQQGLDHYLPPQNYQWAWGNDDGGEKIKTCQVQAQPYKRDDQSLLQLIDNSPSTQALRRQFNYL